MALEFQMCNAAQIDALSRERSVFFFPVGPIEDHGPHLPVGMDLFEAETLCRRLGEKIEAELPGWTAVLMPTLPLGIDSNTTRLALTVRPHVLRDWLVDACLALRRQGFQHFACASGHWGPRQLTTIEEAGKLIARRSLFGIFKKASLVSLNSGLIPASEVRRSPFWPDALEHGGERDTSVALLVSSELVQTLAKGLPPVERETFLFTRGFHRWLRKTSGYWGDPQKASSEKGKAEITRQATGIFPKLRSHLSGSFAPSAFRTWYSIIPSNRSFFRAWMLVLLILIVLGIWATYSLRGYS